jgi:hypothetical protein
MLTPAPGLLDMRKFEYRSARFPTEFAITFTDSHGQISAACTEISRDGMEVHLAHPQPLDNCGRICLIHAGHALELDVRVAYSRQDRCGMQFVYKTGREKELVDNLIADLAGALRRSPQ